jgi:hypothetical protein
MYCQFHRERMKGKLVKYRKLSYHFAQKTDLIVLLKDFEQEASNDARDANKEIGDYHDNVGAAWLVE